MSLLGQLRVQVRLKRSSQTRERARARARRAEAFVNSHKAGGSRGGEGEPVFQDFLQIYKILHYVHYSTFYIMYAELLAYYGHPVWRPARAATSTCGCCR